MAHDDKSTPLLPSSGSKPKKLVETFRFSVTLDESEGEEKEGEEQLKPIKSTYRAPDLSTTLLTTTAKWGGEQEGSKASEHKEKAVSDDIGGHIRLESTLREEHMPKPAETSKSIPDIEIDDITIKPEDEEIIIDTNGLDEGDAKMGATLTLEPIFTDNESMARRRNVSKILAEQEAKFRELAETVTTPRATVPDSHQIGQRAALFKSNDDAMNELLEETLDSRLGPDMLLGLERGMFAWFNRTYLMFIGAVGLMQVENQAAHVMGYFVAAGCIFWIIYNYWLYWVRVGVLNRGEMIQYNENRRPTLFFILLMVASELCLLGFRLKYNSGKRAILLFLKPGESSADVPPGFSAGAVLGISFASSLVISAALVAVWWWVDVRHAYMNTQSNRYTRE